MKLLTLIATRKRETETDRIRTWREENYNRKKEFRIGKSSWGIKQNDLITGGASLIKRRRNLGGEIETKVKKTRKKRT